MKNFSYYLSHFLKEYLVVERNVSSKTIRSYKTTFQMLITYFVEEKNMKLIDITFENVTKEMILDFLNSASIITDNSYVIIPICSVLTLLMIIYLIIYIGSDKKLNDFDKIPF